MGLVQMSTAKQIPAIHLYTNINQVGINNMRSTLARVGIECNVVIQPREHSDDLWASRPEHDMELLIPGRGYVMVRAAKGETVLTNRATGHVEILTMDEYLNWYLSEGIPGSVRKRYLVAHLTEPTAINVDSNPIAGAGDFIVQFRKTITLMDAEQLKALGILPANDDLSNVLTYAERM